MRLDRRHGHGLGERGPDRGRHRRDRRTERGGRPVGCHRRVGGVFDRGRALPRVSRPGLRRCGLRAQPRTQREGRRRRGPQPVAHPRLGLARGRRRVDVLHPAGLCAVLRHQRERRLRPELRGRMALGLGDNGSSGVSGPRKTVVQLPVRVDVSTFGVVSGGTCGDGARSRREGVHDRDPEATRCAVARPLSPASPPTTGSSTLSRPTAAYGRRAVRPVHDAVEPRRRRTTWTSWRCRSAGRP